MAENIGLQVGASLTKVEGQPPQIQIDFLANRFQGSVILSLETAEKLAEGILGDIKKARFGALQTPSKDIKVPKMRTNRRHAR